MEGNVQKMMVIIDEIKTIAQLALNVQSLRNDNSGQLWDIIEKCNSGLSIPIRNCDVGTEEWKQDKEPSPSQPREEGDSVNPECLKKDNGDIVPQIGSVGNAAAMREALMKIWKEVYFYAFDEEKQDFQHLQEAMLEDPPDYKSLRNSFFEIAHLVDAALAEPPDPIGNNAKMREALVWLRKTGHRTPEGGWMCITLKTIQKDGKPYPIEVPPYAEDVINAALSSPPRNCDVGTAEEQIKRWSKFVAHLNHLPEVPYVHSLSWAQMPYDADAEKEGE